MCRSGLAHREHERPEGDAVATVTSSCLEAALSYAARGWRVFPVHGAGKDGGCDCGKQDCTAPAKHPLTRNGLNDASTDEKQIRQWWMRWPRANVAIATGDAFLVIDADLKKDGPDTLKRLAAKLGPIGGTIAANTGGGGYHLLYKQLDPPVTNSSGALGPGVDTRGVGGYIVAPPSRHAAGTAYVWRPGFDPDNAQLAELTLPWADFIQKRLKEKHAATAATGDAGKVAEGGRNDWLTQQAGAMQRRAMSAAAMIAALREENAARCDPPLPDEELRKIVGSVRRYEPGAPPSVNGAAPAAFPEPRKLRDLLANPPPPKRWIVEGILPPGLAILAGRPKAGKSFQALNIALAIAAGGMALGDLPVEQGDVLYLALEGGEEDFHARATAQLAGEPCPDAFDYFCDFPLLDQGGMERLEHWLRTHPNARMIVLDTFQKIRPAGDTRKSAYAQDYDAIAPVANLALRHKVAILVLHHTRKAAADDIFDTVSGTLGLTGAADALWVMRRVRGQGTATVAVTGRGVREQDLGLAWDETLLSWKHVGGAEEVRRSEERNLILNWLVDADEPQTPRDIADALEGQVSYGAVRRLLAALRIAGDVVPRGKAYTAASHVREAIKAINPIKANSANRPIRANNLGRYDDEGDQSTPTDRLDRPDHVPPIDRPAEIAPFHRARCVGCAGPLYDGFCPHCDEGPGP